LSFHRRHLPVQNIRCNGIRFIQNAWATGRKSGHFPEYVNNIRPATALGQRNYAVIIELSIGNTLYFVASSINICCISGSLSGISLINHYSLKIIGNIIQLPFVPIHNFRQLSRPH
jgi:hypothetical protein